MSPLLIFTLVSFLSITGAEDRAHGLHNESPVALSPEAFAFFHPNALQPSTSNPCHSTGCSSSLPLASSTVQSTPAHESASAHRSGQLGAGSIIGIPLGFGVVCLITVGVYYVVIKRRANLRRANLEKPAEP